MGQGGWAHITREVAVTVERASLDGVDLILLGVITGEWPAFERQVALGLELESAHPDAVDADDVRREATAFRYAHDLISAADFRRWLETRELTVRDVSDVLRRRLLRRQGRAGAQSEGPDPAADGEDVIRVLPAEAFCDGVLTRLVERGIAWLAAGQLAPSALTPDEDRLEEPTRIAPTLHALVGADASAPQVRARLSRLLSFQLALEQLRHELAEPSAIARRLKQHALEWTELIGDELRFMHEGAAREARLQITADGDTVGAVAERAEVAVLDRRLLVDEAPLAPGVSFAAAAVGEVVGPWEEDGRWHVMQLRAKLPPSPDNQSLSARASDELLAERIRRYSAGRVTRHGVL
jgi:hypothetical protein